MRCRIWSSECRILENQHSIKRQIFPNHTNSLICCLTQESQAGTMRCRCVKPRGGSDTWWFFFLPKDNLNLHEARTFHGWKPLKRYCRTPFFFDLSTNLDQTWILCAGMLHWVLNHLRIGFLFGSGFATASALSIARRQIFNASAHGTPFAQARAAASRAILFRALARYIVTCSFRFLSLEGRANLDRIQLTQP